MKQFLLSLSVWICLSVAVPVSESMALVPPQHHNIPTTIRQDAPLYPNPAKDHVFLRVDQERKADVEIRNILGNKMPLNLEQTATGVFRIDLAKYPSGYYLVIIQDNSLSENGLRKKDIYKFLKQ